MRRTAVILVMLCLAASLFTMARAAWAQDRVLIFAAASTRDVVEAVIKAFPVDHPTRISGVYAATSALARQIVDGAPAALFLSASSVWMAEVAAAGMVGEQHPVARNRMVLITPRAASAGPTIKDAEDIKKALGNGRLALAETSAVPAGIYARQALRSLGVWPGLRDRLAQAANVRAALLLVERGEVPLGLVYRTDALASRMVENAWTVPASSHAPIIYQLALLSFAESNSVAAALYAFLLSPAGRRIFLDHGFELD